MAEYFSHDYNARSDRRMVALRKKEGMKGVGTYWCIVEMLYEAGGYLPHTSYEDIAYELRVKPEIIRRIVTAYDLFKIDGENFWSDSALRRLDERKAVSEKNRENARIGWNKRKPDAVALPTPSDGNAIKGKESIVKESKGKDIPDPDAFAEKWKAAFDDRTLEDCRMKFPHLDISNELQIFELKCSASKLEYHTRDPGGLRLGFIKQLTQSKGNTQNINGKGSTAHQHQRRAEPQPGKPFGTL